MVVFFVLVFIVYASALECVPPFLTCPSGGCALFAESCNVCGGNQIVCPDNTTCVEDYSRCSLLLFQNQSYTLEQRVTSLVSLLTLQEKVDQLSSFSSSIARLGIPKYAWSHEALHGVAREDGPATAFPQVIGLGATFDPDLIHRIGRAISDESRAKYINDAASGGTSMGITFYAPNINIYRDPRWGRGHETPGEDPFLTSVYGSNYVQGVQFGADPNYLQAVACCKHYVAYNFENITSENVGRHNFNAIVSPRDLYLTYLPAFKDCITMGKAQTVMCSYNALNGIPTCASSSLLGDFLRKSWNFDGFVMSDEGAINDILTGHHYVGTSAEAAAVAVTAGCDQELPPENQAFYNTLVESVQSGKVPESVIDTAISNVMRIRFRLGLFDNPWNIVYNFIPYSIVAGPAHKALTLEAAHKSLVLLKNNDNTLPLNAKTLQSVAVIGPNAAVTDILLGNYAGNPTQIISILQGIQTKLAGESVIYAGGCAEQWCTDKSMFPDAINAAKAAEVIILVMGIRSCPYDSQCWIGRAEIEGEEKDRVSLDLPGYQTDLIQAVLTAAAGKPVVLVLVNGGSLTLPPVVESIDAILEAFYPGEQGGIAVADVLFGDYNPGGRLSTTWVQSINDLPPYLSMSMDNRTYQYFTGTPLFPFGHGLSYTTFEYSDFVLSSSTIQPCQPILVQVVVTNTGNIVGDEVVQVYFTLVARSVPTANVQLVAFTRVNNLNPNEARTVTLNMTYERMVLVDKTDNLVIEPGEVIVSVGGGQPKFSKTLTGTFNIIGSTTPVSQCE